MLRGHAEPFFVFSREFYHPADHVAGLSAAAVARFEADSRRFPAPAYEEASLLWRNSSWRVPSPDERAMMMGIPPSAVAAVPVPEPKRSQVRNSLLGNGFHLPCVMCLMCMLLSISEAKPMLSRFSPKHELRAKLQHTLWEPGYLEHFPGLLGPSEVLEIMRLQFDKVHVCDSVWSVVGQNLQTCNLWLPQAFTAFQRSRGQPWQHLPPRPLLARDRATIFAGNSGQRYASDTSKGLDHLLPPGLGKEEHIVEATRLPSPFDPKPWPEADIFLVRNFARVGA